ncbi:hypothetical protein [Streptomyces poonensis]|uniref:Uncharacterized protein n=1 Tax=Streptomyces poonensis TaxID=68255 RepID=A0A918PQ59_9ACTN|nr:hypothetical protein [Streptomyces poonensis]GGZ17549.1 hypothetical protein GCM10010365_41760 [Streptomyces poonensis]GLJ90958.1 hypothetical protein GCM10017589_35640 [Streptomyces poonensis]
MAGDGQDSEAYTCGRLYSTLHALRVIGTGSSDLKEHQHIKKVYSTPRDELLRHLQQAGEHLHRAVARKEDKRTAAATKLFQALPGALPPGGIPRGNFDNKATADFLDGFRKQLSVFEEEFPALLD